MASFRSCIVLGCFFLLPALAPVDGRAQTTQLSDLLPETTTIYIESMGTQAWLDAPVTQWLMQSPLYAEIWRSPDVMKLRGGITVAELLLGERVPSLLAKATTGGVTMIGDVSTRGVALIGDCGSKDACDALYKRLLKLAENEAKNPLQGSGFKQVDYRGLPAYEVNQAIVVALDRWLVVGNKAELLRQLADHYLDHPQLSLSSNKSFAEYRQQLSAGADKHVKAPEGEPATRASQQAVAWAWVNVEQLKAAGVGKKVFKGPRDNFLAELLIGGMLATLRDAPNVAARLETLPSGVQLRMLAPRYAQQPSLEYAYFFGADGAGTAPVPIAIEGRLATLAVHRDLRALWRAAGDLFEQRVNDQLAQADATLTTLFSGRDFGEEILGALEPGWQFVVASNEYTANPATIPEIKLPAFALVAKLRDPERMQPQLKRIFMSLAGFVNVTGAMNQQPQLDIDIETSSGKTMVATRFEAEADRPARRSVPMQFNFSPTLLMQQETFVLASTRTLAESISQQLDKSSGAAKNSPAAQARLCNTWLALDGEQIASALMNNHDQMVTQNMLEKGHSQTEATKEVDMFVKIVKLIRALEVTFDVSEQAELKVKLDVR